MKAFTGLIDERGCCKTRLWGDFSTLAVHHHTGCLQTCLLIYCVKSFWADFFTLIHRRTAVLLLMDMHLCWLHDLQHSYIKRKFHWDVRSDREQGWINIKICGTEKQREYKTRVKKLMQSLQQKGENSVQCTGAHQLEWRCYGQRYSRMLSEECIWLRCTLYPNTAICPSPLPLHQSFVWVISACFNLFSQFYCWKHTVIYNLSWAHRLISLLLTSPRDN